MTWQSHCQVESARSITELAGDGEEDTALLLDMKQEATAFLAKQKWCERVTGIYWGDGIGGVVAVFLFTFESAPGVDALAAPAWCVVGDLPSLLLPCLGRKDTPVDVLERYCSEMDRWAQSVRGGEGGVGCVSVGVAPTIEHAEMLHTRVRSLREDIIPELRIPR